MPLRSWEAGVRLCFIVQCTTKSESMIRKGYHFDIICGILTHGVTKQHKSDLRFPDISDGQAVLLQETYL